MGYTGTTNYGFQKPAKENAFTVDDLNNALDKIDETIKGESVEQVSVDLDDDMNLKVELTKGNGSKQFGSMPFPDINAIEFVTTLPAEPESGKVYGIIPKYGIGYIPLDDLQYYLNNPMPDDAIYSIIYDKSKASDPSGCLTYADACEGFEPMLGGSGNVDEGNWKQGFNSLFDKIEVGYFNYTEDGDYCHIGDTWNKVSKNSISFNGPYNFTRIPKIYQKVESLDSNRVKLSLSLAQFDGSTLHPSFIIDNIEKSYTYIGRTLGSMWGLSHMTSTANSAPETNFTRANFRINAKSHGTAFNMTTYYDRDLVNKLYLMGFKNFNSQVALGPGRTNGSAKSVTGGTAGKSWMYGSSSDVDQISFLGLEDWWGNLYQWIDDYVLYNGTIYVGTNSNPTDNTSGKTAIGQFGGSSGAYPLKAKFGLNDTFISEASGGSTMTGMCDYQYWNNSGNVIGHAGGDWNSRSLTGAFYLYSMDSGSASGSDIGARLTYKP